MKREVLHPEVLELRLKIIEFVKEKSWRAEETIVEYVMLNLLLDGSSVSSDDATHQLARCVEDGPLHWFGAEEEKHGPNVAGEMPLRYRYDEEKAKKWKPWRTSTRRKRS